MARKIAFSRDEIKLISGDGDWHRLHSRPCARKVSLVHPRTHHVCLVAEANAQPLVLAYEVTGLEQAGRFE